MPGSRKGFGRGGALRSDGRPRAEGARLGGASWLSEDVGALEELQLPLLQDVKALRGLEERLCVVQAAFTHLRNDSNVSLEDQAKEQVAALVNSVKSVVKEEEEEKSFLAKGQSCKRKCAKKMDRHLGNTCA